MPGFPGKRWEGAGKAYGALTNGREDTPLKTFYDRMASPYNSLY